ncbi:MAG TPA: CHRD domain-containing protein [Gemmatimonadaceae bacterium]|nr:CHRD domain-containing protein [Gemmatimonadaceae bacterium]
MHTKARFAAGVVSALVMATVVAGCDDDDDDGLVGLSQRVYTATMFGTNEIPANTGAGAGSAVFIDNTTRIDWTMTLDNISEVTASHIHGPALPNANAGVLVNLFIPASPTGALNNFTATGTITSSTNPNVSLDSLRTLMNTGRAYVNVHTTPIPAGAIRGQIVRTN